MGVLASALFTEGDAATVKKLEDCATGRPTEFRSHFSRTENSKGEHILRVQKALKRVQQNEPELGIPGFQENGVYDADFARAIRVYKEKRQILNYAKKVDDIVGVKTIRSLDSDAQKRRQLPDDPRPNKDRPVPRPPRPNNSTCMTDAELPTNTVFDIQLIVGGSGGEILEAGLFSFVIIDHMNRLSCLYSLTSGGLGTPGLPITPSGGGKASRFTTPKPVKITRFGPIGGLTSITVGPPYGAWSPDNVTIVSLLSFGYRTELSNFPTGMITIRGFDTGPISIQGAGLQGGKFTCLNQCRGELGAERI